MSEKPKTNEPNIDGMQKALHSIHEALTPLSHEARVRVLASVAILLDVGDEIVRRIERVERQVPRHGR